MTRLEAATGSSYPGNGALGVVDDVGLTERIAASMGAELAAVGVNLDFAPVADVNTNPRNPVIGIRSFGSDEELVARHVAAFVRGLQRAGVGRVCEALPGPRRHVGRLAPRAPVGREPGRAGARTVPGGDRGRSAIDHDRAHRRALARRGPGHDEPRAPPRPPSQRARIRRPGRDGRARDEGDQRNGRRRGRRHSGDRRRRRRALSRSRSLRRVRPLGPACARGGRSLEAPSRRATRLRCLPRGRDRSGVAPVGGPRRSRGRPCSPLGARCWSTATRESTARCSSSSSSPRSGWLQAGFRSCLASGSARSCPTPSCGRSTRDTFDPGFVRGGRSLVVIARDAHRHEWERAAIDALTARAPDAIVVEIGLPQLASGRVGDVRRDVRSGPRERGSRRRGAILGLATRGGAVR